MHCELYILMKRQTRLKKKKNKTLKLNHKDHWQHSEKVRLLTAQQNGLKFPALVGYCAFWGLRMFVFLVAGLQLLLKTSRAPRLPCVYRINAQTRGL